MSRSVLVDLSALRDLYCGLGQVALSYGRYFEKNYRKADATYSLTLLVPDDMIGKFGNEVSYLSSSRRLTRKFQFLFPKFDVWHSIHQSTRFKPRYPKTKYILTIHDLNYLYETKGLNRLTKHLKLQQKISKADEIVCISKFTKAEVEEHTRLKGKKCRVIYNHIEPLNKSQFIEPTIEIKKPFFFSLGVIQMKKNFHVLLDLMKLYPDRHLYIAGKESKKAQKNGYAEMIKSRILNENITNVTLLGGITHEEKIWFYENCEAFLFPSLFEGFGIPVVEAMQFGKAVFCSQETSLKEIGSEYAFFWDNFDAKNMKLLIDRNLDVFYNDKERVLKEIEYAMSFTSDSHFKQYEKLYETV